MFIKNILKHCQPAKLGVFRVFRAFCVRKNKNLREGMQMIISTPISQHSQHGVYVETYPLVARLLLYISHPTFANRVPV